jgi:hypothetical protein
LHGGEKIGGMGGAIKVHHFVEEAFLSPRWGLTLCAWATHGLRRGLYSSAASRLGIRGYFFLASSAM